MVVERGKIRRPRPTLKTDASRGATEMKKLALAMSLAAGALMTVAPAFAADENEGRGQAVVTVLPVNDKEAAPANLSQQDLIVKVNGKDSTITNWTPLRGINDRLELVLLIDGAARTSLATQLNDMSKFINGLPPTA